MDGTKKPFKPGVEFAQAVASGDEMQALNAFIKYDQARKKQTADKIVSEFRKGKIPTSPELRQQILLLSGNERIRAMSNHCFWKEWQLRQGLFSLLDAAHQAAIDIDRHEAALAAYSKDQNDFTEHFSHTIGNPFQRDTVSYCAAVLGAKQTSDEIAKVRQDIAEQIDDATSKCFATDLGEFIWQFRNNLMHGAVVVPGWSISFGEKNNNVGSMTVHKHQLLSFGRWKDGAKRFINSTTGDHVDIGEVISEHCSLLLKFAAEMRHLFAVSILPQEDDFFCIEDEHKRWGKQQWNKILVTQIAEGKNPYEHLHRFFTPEEVREIRRRPNHTKEQVDFIISIRLVESACDEGLRNDLYNLFGVKDSDR